MIATDTKTEIKILPIEEIGDLIPLAIEFISESTENIPFDKEVFKSNWVNLYGADAGKILCAYKDGKKIGALGFLLYNDLLSGEYSALEAFWFITKENRGEGMQLLEQFEDEAQKLGVKRVLMAHLSRLMPEKIKSIYLKRGYRHIETTYVKEFE